MGVCRGRISEGIDFKDDEARCVVIIGIPYASLSDIRIILKKDFLDEKIQNNFRDKKNVKSPNINKLISGDDWYRIQAIRAVNQAIGRVIRHIRDYGAIFLIDERYQRIQVQHLISGWLRDQISTETDYNRLG